MLKGNKVIVFEDPITCQKREGVATVTKVLQKQEWQDAEGRQMYRCNVRFAGDRQVFERDVSYLA